MLVVAFMPVGFWVSSQTMTGGAGETYRDMMNRESGVEES